MNPTTIPATPGPVTVTPTVDVVCYYHDPVKAPLLRAGMLPAVRALPAGVHAHLERGWLHGPHLRIRLTGAGADDVAVAARALAARLRDHLVAHPSPVHRTSEQLRAASVALGRAELVPPPYEPFAPDNTVDVEVLDDATVQGWRGTQPGTAGARAAVLGAGLDAVEATVVDLGARDDTPAARVRATIVALTVHADVGPWRLAGDHLSYLSHLEAHLHHVDRSGRLRAALDARWEQHADDVTALVAACIDPAESDPLVTAWRGWAERGRLAAARAHDAGGLPAVSWTVLEERGRRIDDAAAARWDIENVSEFHRLIGVRVRDAQEERLFAIEKFVDNMLYLLLAVVDVTPDERYLAASLVWRAAERLTGRTWREAFGVDDATPAVPSPSPSPSHQAQRPDRA